VLTLRAHQWDAVLEQLQAAYPLEACGLMAGRHGRVEQLYPITNRLFSAVEFDMEPHELLAAMMDLEKQGWELQAIYHSHPDGPEFPSPLDVARATYSEALQVIISLAERWNPTMRAFQVARGMVTEVELLVE
jgi:proteasome lid subunit RPN8/RPN11